MGAMNGHLRFSYRALSIFTADPKTQTIFTSKCVSFEFSDHLVVMLSGLLLGRVGSRDSMSRSKSILPWIIGYGVSVSGRLGRMRKVSIRFLVLSAFSIQDFEIVHELWCDECLLRYANRAETGFPIELFFPKNLIEKRFRERDNMASFDK